VRNPNLSHHFLIILHPMASSSNSTSTTTADGNNCYQYDVFINHRGPDVKKTFASHLYHRLSAHGLRVFLDQEVLQKGDNLTPQIKGAIRTASVQIAIFSTNYCQSRWCLDELLLMLESGSTVIPIFYNVKPSELRWTEGDNGVYTRVLRKFNRCSRTRGEIGVYARALLNLEKKKTFDFRTRQQKPRYDSGTIRKWRKALYDVADIIGFELEAYNGRDEGQLLVDVVERVLEKIPKTPLDVSKYPTGLDDKVTDFEDFEGVLLQEHENGKARVVGIVGCGGIGKTTLSKHFFNRKRSYYPRSCFLFDVRESSLKSLQSTLLDDLTPLSEQINSTAEGIEKIRKHISSSPALIILDDVDNINQLDALLLPARDVLDSNSLILVTSRDKNVLTSWGIGESSIFKLQGLNRQHSTELFCWHAFHQPRPVERFGEVVNKFVNGCDGLPLSLTVIGALLYGEKDLENWEAQWLRFSNIPPRDIRDRLKISYDSLEEDERQIFLDVACFFIGEDKDTAIRIWNGCGWEGRLCLQKLNNKCLVEFHRKKCSILDPVLEVDGKDCIKMHDNLRDLGRYLAERETSRRLWRRDFNLSPNSAVRGITNFAQPSPWVPYMSDWQLRSLRLLRAEGCLDEVFRVGQSPELIWLCWSNCPYSSLPSIIPMKNLTVLCLKGSKLTTPWKHNSEVPLQLRELHIATDVVLKIPKSVGQLKHLEKIVLEPDGILKRMRLKTFPDEFGDLQSLKHLELRSCSNLISFPDCFCRLTNLEHINLYECSGLQTLPDAFGKLTNLRHLSLSHSQLQTFPDSFGKLTKLQHIDLSHCDHLKMLPSCFENLRDLRYVVLSHCRSLETITSYVWKITNLNMANCKRLKKGRFAASPMNNRSAEYADALSLGYITSFAESSVALILGYITRFTFRVYHSLRSWKYLLLYNSIMIMIF